MKIKVAIIYGGPGSEHEVSVWSANNVFDNIDYDKFDLIKIFCDEDLNFFINNNQESISLDQVCDFTIEQDILKVFPVLHGEFGEGGQLQKILEGRKINFVGSGSAVSSIAIDKIKSNEIFTINNINIPKSEVVAKNTIIDTTKNFNFPIILKPISEGSSIGLHKIKARKDLDATLIDLIFKSHGRMLMQEFVQGREFTCAVVDMDSVGEIALIPTEILLTSKDTFDYESKYTPNMCNEVIDPDLDEVYLQRIKELALNCHKLLGCKDLSRTDIIMTDETKLFVLETNTIPGMTTNSFLPKQLVASGYTFKDFLTHILSK